MSLPKDILGPQKDVNWRHPLRILKAHLVRTSGKRIGEPPTGDNILDVTENKTGQRTEVTVFIGIPNLSIAQREISTPTSRMLQSQIRSPGRVDHILGVRLPIIRYGFHVIDENGGHRNRRHGGNTTIATASHIK